MVHERLKQDMQLSHYGYPLWNQTELAAFFGVSPATLHPFILRNGECSEDQPECILIPDFYTQNGKPLFSRDRIYTSILMHERLQRWRLKVLDRDVSASE